jgi:acyl-homoserine-lactone acylase
VPLGMRRLTVVAVLFTLVLAGAGAALARTEHHSRHAARLQATIIRTRYGVPHITAGSWKSLGFGFGYAFAADDLCTIAQSYVTVDAQRSRYFGPNGSWDFQGNGTVNNNLDSDFFYGAINNSGVIQRMVRERPPNGPLPQGRQLINGYVKGYNLYLRRTGVNHLPDPRCRGAKWVHPIKAIDVYRVFYQLGSLASSGVAIDGIGSAAPTANPTAAAAAQASSRAALAQLAAGKRTVTPFPLAAGSNGIALGSQATQNRMGMVLANPHFPWVGGERFYQVQLRIPGHLDVSGATLYGVPLVLIGQTNGLAWTHTVATAWRFTPYELTLAPNNPYAYMVDGKQVAMHGTRVTVTERSSSGALTHVTRTLYSTEFGPMMTSIMGIPLPWTQSSAWALGDVNAHNFRFLNHFLLNDQAQSVRRYNWIERHYEGIPWVNSIAADRNGHAYYTMDGAIPYVTNAQAQSCAASGAGAGVFQATGIPFLDGSRSACRWQSSRQAAAPGIFPASMIPTLERRDYVENSNDSHWMTNPQHPLTGFARVIGDEGTERSMRTRLGLQMISQRLAGTDGLPGKRFTPADLATFDTSNKTYLSELWRAPLVSFCRSHPLLLGSSGPVNVSPACPVLASWDGRYDAGARGAILFRRFTERLFANTVAVPTGSASAQYEGQDSFFTQPFSSAHPTTTPSGLNTANPMVGRALADAVHDLNSSGIPLNAPLGQYQYVTRRGTRIPLGGGPGDPYGVFDAINNSWVAGQGYPDVPDGSSFIAVMSFQRHGCPVRQMTFLTYGESENPTSVHNYDYTKAFSQGRWANEPFCAAQVRRQARSIRRISAAG